MAKCSTCKKEVLHVRDDFTGATFPVDADPVTLRGFVLEAPKEGERNRRAVLQTVEVFEPHNTTCEQLGALQEGTEGDG